MPEETTQQAAERKAAEKLIQIQRRTNIDKRMQHEVLRSIREQDKQS